MASRQRAGANEIIVRLPSVIPECKALIASAEAEGNTHEYDGVDYYADPARRLSLLDRDKYRCVYCLLDISEDKYHLDHIVPLSRGGSNRKNNLLASCEDCNQRKQGLCPSDS